MASKSSHETEIKLAVESTAMARRLLRAAGFHVHRRRVFEQNTIFDTQDRALRRDATLLRIREVAKDVILTYKGRPEASRHKSREEIETHLSDAAAMRAILHRLGFEPGFRYEKYRTEYKQSSRSGVATLDETPIGVFVELEGDPAWIDRTAARLGFSEKDYVLASYARLYLEWCDRQGKQPTNMVF